MSNTIRALSEGMLDEDMEEEVLEKIGKNNQESSSKDNNFG